jgi:hypothetical protein
MEVRGRRGQKYNSGRTMTAAEGAERAEGQEDNKGRSRQPICNTCNVN